MTNRGLVLNTDKKTPEDSFRESLQDVVVIVQKLIPLCSQVSDLADILELALVNDTQLKLILAQVTKK